MPTTYHLGGSNAEARRTDALRAGELVFTSPRGVLRAQRLLIEALPKRAPGRALFGLDTEGAVALAARAIWGPGDLHWFHLDAYVAAKVRRVLADNRVTDVPLDALEDPPAGPFDLIALPFPSGGEHLFMLDVMERAHDALAVGGRFVAATDGKPDALRKQLKKVFGNFTPAAPQKRIKGACFYAERKREKSVASDHSHVLEIELAHAPGEGADVGTTTQVSVETRPGTFSHGSVDRGSRALAEWLRPAGEDSFLDLGAGCGLIGLSLAKRVPGAHVTLVDSNARAVACALRNAERNGVADRVQVVLRADLEALPPSRLDATRAEGEPEQRGYARVVGNPPYFGQFRIARSFTETAYDQLRPGGKVDMVARTGKASELLSEVLREVFGHTRTTTVGDYAIVSATR